MKQLFKPTGRPDIRLQSGRFEWVDYAKGICIILVVLMHATINVENYIDAQAGWMRDFVDWARPFRMPAFFMVAGLFLHRSIHSSFWQYLDRKLIHFAYFFVIWMTLLMGISDVGLLLSDPAQFLKNYLYAYIEPPNSMWFIHMLAIFFMVTRLIKDIPVGFVLAGAAGLQSVYQLGFISEDWDVLYRFCNRYIYFYVGYAFSSLVFDYARVSAKHFKLTGLGLILWVGVNAVLVAGEWHDKFLSSLLMGFVGAGAVISISLLLESFAKSWSGFIRFCGQHSIVIYLTYPFPLHASMLMIKKLKLPIFDAGSVSFLVCLISVAGPLIGYLIIQKTPLRFLYERPDFLKLKTKPVVAKA